MSIPGSRAGGERILLQFSSLLRLRVKRSPDPQPCVIGARPPGKRRQRHEIQRTPWAKSGFRVSSHSATKTKKLPSLTLRPTFSLLLQLGFAVAKNFPLGKKIS
jgi:hypothetical protein